MEWFQSWIRPPPHKQFKLSTENDPRHADAQEQGFEIETPLHPPITSMWWFPQFSLSFPGSDVPCSCTLSTSCYATYLTPVGSIPKRWMTALLNTKLENIVNSPAMPVIRQKNMGTLDKLKIFDLSTKFFPYLRIVRHFCLSSEKVYLKLWHLGTQ